MLCSSCGFQGRKYTTGHYWNGRNQIEYENQSERVQEFSVQSKELIELDLIEDKTELDTLKIPLYTKKSKENYEARRIQEKEDSIQQDIIKKERLKRQSEYLLEVASIPKSVIDLNKDKNRELGQTFLLSILLFPIFGGLVGFGLNNPELVFIPIIAIVIYPYFIIRKHKKLKAKIGELQIELKKYETSSSEKKWYQIKIQSINDADLLRTLLALATVGLYILCLLILLAFYSGG